MTLTKEPHQSTKLQTFNCLIAAKKLQQKNTEEMSRDNEE